MEYVHTWESTENRHGPGPWIAWKDAGAARRVEGAQGGSIVHSVPGRTSPLRTSCRAQEGALSRRRRTYIRVYHLHYSPRFLECPGYDAPTLLRAMDRAVAHIGIGPESLWTWYMGSMEGPGGRTPCAPSPLAPGNNLIGLLVPRFPIDQDQQK